MNSLQAQNGSVLIRVKFLLQFLPVMTMLPAMKKLRLIGKKTECLKTRLHIFLQATTGGRQVLPAHAVLILKFSTGLEKDFRRLVQTKAQTAKTGWKSGTTFLCSTTVLMRKRLCRFQRKTLTQEWGLSAQTASCREKPLFILQKFSSQSLQKSRNFLLINMVQTQKKTRACELLQIIAALLFLFLVTRKAFLLQMSEQATFSAA